MALRLSHVTGHRHWYFYVLALVCVGWWKRAADDDELRSRSPRMNAAAAAGELTPSPSERQQLINLTNFRYALQRAREPRGRDRPLLYYRFVSHSCRNSSRCHQTERCPSVRPSSSSASLHDKFRLIGNGSRSLRPPSRSSLPHSLPPILSPSVCPSLSKLAVERKGGKSFRARLRFSSCAQLLVLES